MNPKQESDRPVKSLVSGGIAIKEVSIHVVPSMVFAALTKPSKLNTWFTTGAKVDLRVGGRYSNFDKDAGRFLEIVPNKRLRFTWDNPDHAPGTIVEVVLTRNRGSTIVTLLHYGFSKKTDFEHYSSQASGWDWALYNLKAYLEKKTVVQYEEWLEREKLVFSKSVFGSNPRLRKVTAKDEAESHEL
ncbi:MAG TPA: SRPBCC domain-containing protein [Candidatus Bathyarchaeia archaeon]|nr:SRPBCC domain-containing protein [Candidatus Bathyarchaeia archaeon]